MKHQKIVLGATAFAAAFIFATNVNAYDQGADNSKYQGSTFVKAQASDKFGISQIGGIYSSKLITQDTYKTQISTGIAQSLRMHTYIWLSDGSNRSQTKTGLDYFLPKIQTPKGSIVAIDYEAGASSDKEANTANVEYALQRIKDAGYTPMLYSYKSYMDANLNTDELATKFGDEYIWIARYPHSYVTTTPDFSGFPSYKYVGQWQFTSMARAAGLDYNVDLLGVTKNGYDGTTTSSNTEAAKVKANSSTTAIKQGQKANNTPKSDIKVGYTVKVNFSAKKWANGVSIPSWVKGKSYTVQQVNGSKVLLANILSWISKGDVEILQTAKQATGTSSVAKSANNLPAGVHAQSGYFTPNQRSMVWHSAGYNPTYHYYYKGETIKYQGYIDNGTYRYVVYKGASGHWCYVADRHLKPNYMLGYAR